MIFLYNIKKVNKILTTVCDELDVLHNLWPKPG